MVGFSGGKNPEQAPASGGQASEQQGHSSKKISTPWDILTELADQGPQGFGESQSNVAKSELDNPESPDTDSLDSNPTNSESVDTKPSDSEIPLQLDASQPETSSQSEQLSSPEQNAPISNTNESSDQFETMPIPSAPEVEETESPLSLFASSLEDLYASYSDYNRFFTDDVPNLNLDKSTLQSLIELSKTSSGRKELLDIIEHQDQVLMEDISTNNYWSRSADEMLNSDTISPIQRFGVLLLKGTYSKNSNLYSEDELASMSPQVQLLRQLDFNTEGFEQLELSFNAIDNLIHLGLANEKLHNDTREHTLNHDSYSEISDYLNLTEESHAYWNEQSRAIGQDLLPILIDVTYTFDDEKRFKKFFSPSGLPKEKAFKKPDGFLAGLYHENSSLYGLDYVTEAYFNFVQNNTQHFPADKQWLIQVCSDSCYDEAGNFSASTLCKITDATTTYDAWNNSDSHGPNRHFWKEAIKDPDSKIDSLRLLPNFDQGTTPQEKTFLSLPSPIREHIVYDSPRYRMGLHGKMKPFISKDGEPKQSLVNLAWQSSDLGAILQLSHDFPELNLSKQQQHILEVYSQINDSHMSKAFEDFITNSQTDYEIIPGELLSRIPNLLIQISESNASEIRSAKGALARELLQSGGNMEQKLDQIESVYLRNHLPYFAKAFSTFDILHPDERLDEKITDYNVSPVLKAEQAHPVEHRFQTPRQTIFSDLVKCAFYSNNRSVRDFLNQVESGQTLTDQILSGEKSLDQLTISERSDLQDFTKQLTTVYNQTTAGQKQPRADLPELSEAQLANLVAAFGPNQRYTLGDRVVRMFAYPVGIKSLAKAKQLIGSLSDYETERHRRLVEQGRLTLEKGDIIKGLGSVEYVGNILQNGSVAKEFLGDSADSDLTPLDTDVSVISTEGPSLNDTINSTAAGSYGGSDQIWLAMKHDDRFVTTRTPDDSPAGHPIHDPSKLELFSSDATGREDHYGIRTGFPSSDIDFFIKDGPTDHLALEIVKNGFYIPIVDTKGQLVFSPEQYDELRAQTAGQSYYGNPDFTFGKLETPDTLAIASELGQSSAETITKRSAIESAVEAAISQITVDGRPLTLKTVLDGDLTPGAVELIDTGSTGRGTNVSDDSDFDFIMRVDRRILDDPALLEQIKDGISAQFTGGEHDMAGGDFRYKDVSIPGLDTPVDLDISFLQRTNKMEHSTDAAVRDVLTSIARESAAHRASEIANLQGRGLSTDNLGPTEYELVIANIIAAKEFFKSDAVAAYKPDRGPNPQGGLGGVGIENWILQHGGSFEDASRSFLAAVTQAEQAAHSSIKSNSSSSANERIFREFQQLYSVWDFGQNHFAIRINEEGESYRYPHDNFVTNNMSAEGFARIALALREKFGNSTVQ